MTKQQAPEKKECANCGKDAVQSQSMQYRKFPNSFIANGWFCAHCGHFMRKEVPDEKAD